MKKRFNLKTEGMKYKSFFNNELEKIENIIEINHINKYLKIDLVRKLDDNSIKICKRICDFKKNLAILELNSVKILEVLEHE